MDGGMLNTLALKLGLTSPATLRKAEELNRLMSVQGCSGLSLSMSSKAVICLEIAASITGASLDKNLVIKLSGLKRSQYIGTSQTVSRLLNVSPGVSVAELCVTHSATAATSLAQRVLKQYESSTGRNKDDLDTSLPVYQTAAVSAACKIMKIKVNQQRLFESSRSKKAVFKRLVDAMMKIAQTLHKEKGAKGGSKRPKTLMDMVEDNLRECSPEKRSKVVEKNCEDEKEGGDKDADFEAWKKRILEAAAAVE